MADAADSDGDGNGGSRRSARVRTTTRRTDRRQGKVHVLSAGQRHRLYAQLQRRSQVRAPSAHTLYLPLTTPKYVIVNRKRFTAHNCKASNALCTLVDLENKVFR